VFDLKHVFEPARPAKAQVTHRNIACTPCGGEKKNLSFTRTCQMVKSWLPHTLMYRLVNS